MERKGGVGEGVWEPEARARTSVPASLAANRPLALHPFRSRETPAPRASSGGSGAAPYHGELAEGWRVSVGNSSYLIGPCGRPETPPLPGGGVVGVALGPPGEAAGARKIGPRALISSALPPLVPLPPGAPGGSRPSFQLLAVDGFLLPRFPSYTNKSLPTSAPTAPTKDWKTRAQQKRP